MSLLRLPTHWRARRLRASRSQAAAELVTLLPVYLLLFVMSIYVGRFQIITAETVELARFKAWSVDGSMQVPSRSFFRRFENGKLNISEPNQGLSSVQNILEKALDDQSGSNEAKELAKAYAMNQGGTGLNIGRRQSRVTVNYGHPWYVTGFYTRNFQAIREHVAYVPRSLNDKDRRHYESDQVHPFLYTYARNPPGGLEEFDVFGDRDTPKIWFPHYSTPFAGGRWQYVPSPGDNYSSQPDLWNTRHQIQAPLGWPQSGTNPFFVHPKNFFR